MWVRRPVGWAAYLSYMALERLVCTWSTTAGVFGYSNFYGTAGGGAQSTFNAFWTGIKPYIPVGISVNVPNTGDTFDESTGKKTGVWGSGSTSKIDGTAAGQFSAPSGGVIRWNTNNFLNGHNVRGRTFLVPLGVICYGTNGSLLAGTVSAIQAAAQSLITTNGNVLKVWHRPRYSTASPPVLLEPGQAFSMVTATVPVKAAVLKSRRD